MGFEICKTEDREPSQLDQWTSTLRRRFFPMILSIMVLNPQYKVTSSVGSLDLVQHALHWIITKRWQIQRGLGVIWCHRRCHLRTSVCKVHPCFHHSTGSLSIPSTQFDLSTLIYYKSFSSDAGHIYKDCLWWNRPWTFISLKKPFFCLQLITYIIS